MSTPPGISRTVIYSSPFIPPEWIEAHGFVPQRVLHPDGTGNRYIPDSEGICPFMRLFANQAASTSGAAALILAGTCDQMRRCADIIEGEATPLFLMNIPATWQHPEAHRLYRSELERLGHFLVRLGGSKPSASALIEMMNRYGQKREDDRTQMAHGKGIPVALIGGPLARHDLGLVDVLHEAGGAVVLDASETGERGLPAHFNRRRMKDDPLGELVDAYFGTIPDAFQRPNSRLYQWFVQEFVAREVRGVILLRYVWCDLWHAEKTRLRECIGMPLLDIDLDGEDPVPRNRTRIEAFLEGLTCREHK